MRTWRANTPSHIGSPLRNGRAWLALATTLAISAGCDPGTSAASTPTRAAASSASSLDLPEVLATIGGEPVTLDDVRRRVGDELDRLETTFLIARSNAVDATLRNLLRERVLQDEATRKGKTVDEMILEEAGGSLAATEDEIANWFIDNQERTGGRSLGQVSAQIGDFLRAQRQEEAIARLEARLNAERKVEVLFEPYRIAFNEANAPSKGPDDAPVTVVEFSDFECPFCGRFFHTLRRLEEEYEGRIRVVYKQFPLTSIHPNAFKAAEASLCAQEQGNFWAYHDLMFQDQSTLTVRDLKEKAGRLGMDQAAFDACLDSGRYVEQVQEDLREGSRVGIGGTPAVFINGAEVPGGAVAYDQLAAAVEDALAAAAGSRD